MAYWICTDVIIEDEGRAVTMRVEDRHSATRLSTTLPTEEWQRILTYKSAWEEPFQRVADLHKQLSLALWDELEMREKRKEASDE